MRTTLIDVAGDLCFVVTRGGRSLAGGCNIASDVWLVRVYATDPPFDETVSGREGAIAFVHTWLLMNDPAYEGELGE